jgi:hypothetical protein
LLLVFHGCKTKALAQSKFDNTKAWKPGASTGATLDHCMQKCKLKRQESTAQATRDKKAQHRQEIHRAHPEELRTPEQWVTWAEQMLAGPRWNLGTNCRTWCLRPCLVLKFFFFAKDHKPKILSSSSKF